MRQRLALLSIVLLAICILTWNDIGGPFSLQAKASFVHSAPSAASTSRFRAAPETVPLAMAGLGPDRYGVNPLGQPRDTWMRHELEAVSEAERSAADPDVPHSRRNSGSATPVFPNSTYPNIFMPLVARRTHAPVLPLRLDCGSDTPYVTQDGTTYLPDHAWTPGVPYGYLGGYPDLPIDWWEGNLVGATDEPALYKTLRRDWQEYRVGSIPNGDYLLTLRFNEQIHHGPDFSVFDIVIEGQTVLEDLDVWAEHGRYYALDARFGVALEDGELNIAAVPVAGEPHLAALELVARPRDADPPDVPSHLAAISGYGSVLLDWADGSEEDLAGYHVYRADQPEGPYTRVTVDRPVFRSRYEDRVEMVHLPYSYRVSAVDVYGNESARCESVSQPAIELGDATLPVYQLAVSSDNLAVIYGNPWSDDRVPATFTASGQEYAAEVRFRGSSSRSAPKKSWKVKFPGDSPIPTQDRFNVNAHWSDASLMRVMLVTGLFEAAGVRPPEAEHVLLALNGDYMGVYTRVEQPNQAFLIRTGRNPQASIYKALDKFAEVQPSEAYYRAFYEKKTNEYLGYEDLISFIELLNNTPDEEFAAELAAVMDVEAYLDYYAIHVLTANIDSARHNIYMVHDLATDKWELVPWDLDVSFGHSASPIDQGTHDHPEYFGHSNILRTRVLKVPEFRAYYCSRLAEYMDTIFSDAVMHPKVDALYAAVEQDGLRDWLKLNWEQSDPFLDAPVSIKWFITQRKEHLRGEMETFCADQ